MNISLGIFILLDIAVMRLRCVCCESSRPLCYFESPIFLELAAGRA